MITSKLTRKAQTRIPQPVRAALDLREGDEIAYRLDGERVFLTKVAPAHPMDDHFRAFDEWYSAADARAYADL